MKRFFFTIAFIALGTGVLLGQGKGSGHFEIGAGYAPFFLVSVDDSFDLSYKADVYCEWRNKLGRVFDWGVKADLKYNPITGYNGADVFSYSGNQYYGAILAITDVNVHIIDRYGLFAGIGIGPGLVLTDITEANMDKAKAGVPSPVGLQSEFLVVVSPRIGMELFSHLRFSASVDIATAMESTRWPVCFNVGLTF